MSEYVVSAIDATEPNDDRPASYLGIEMRTLKAHNNTVNQAQGETNTSVAEDLAAIEALFNTTTGVAGLPADKGVLNVLLALYKEVFGYTEGESVVPSLAAKIAALDTSLNNTLNGALGTLTNTVNQHTTSINSLISTVSQHGTALNNHSVIIGYHTTSINDLASSVAFLQNSPSTRLPVGGILITTDSANPGTYIGYGTWEQTCKGCFPVGVGDGTSRGGWNIKYVFPKDGSYIGAKAKTLTVDNMPAHTHSYTGPIGTFNSGGSQSSPPTQAASGNVAKTTGSAGSGQAFDIMPASLQFYFWQRMT